LRNGGIRLNYETRTAELQGVKPGILLERNFLSDNPVVLTEGPLPEAQDG
jgi:hypothetical protein